MARLSLQLFGPTVVSLDGEEVPGFRTSKVLALLVYLVIEAQAHSRESLMELLWPGMPEHSARHNLRQILYHLRAAIPELNAGDKKVDALLANRQSIQLNPAAQLEADVHHFEALIESTQKHDHVELLLCQQCREDLVQAVALYQGDFLADFYLDDSNEFENWSQARRQAYRRQALDALEILTAMQIRRNEYAGAREYAERQLSLDNLREGAYRQLMEIQALSGRREEALATYERAQRVLAEDLGMRPSKRTTDMYEQILAGELSFKTTTARGIRGYELKDEIGEGAYGTIHRAIQPSVGREVAVKIIRRKLANDPEFIRRFEAEAQTVAQLEHPFVVPLYDYWRDPDGAYLVMRYLRGGSLLSALSSGPWKPEPAAAMLEQIAAALDAAHRRGIVHRDIKPANILLDEAGNTFLSDFGIAKNLGQQQGLTIEGAVIGTPDYISPEQILAEEVTPQTDIYSLGAVLYETLTGEKPFPDSSVANLIYKHLNEPIPLVADSRPDLAPQIDAVIQRATAKRPTDRYASALEMAEAFQRAVRGADESAIAATPLIRPEVAEIYNPYKGLRAFQEADADDFFGREALVQQLIRRLDPEKTTSMRFLAVVGPSGSGKSSAIKAGLIPALRTAAIEGSNKWFVAEMVPGTHPLEELELALWPVAVDPPPSLVEPMQRDSRGMLRTIRRVLPDEPDAQLLLIIDQFEELFTLVDDEERRDFFIDSLLQAIAAPRSPLRVIISLRADFYDRPLQYETLGRLIKENTETVLPLTTEELTWSIREPARRVGVGLERGLSEAIIGDVTDQPGALPLLQYAMTELFERRQDGRMSKSAYVEIGGVLGALGRRADEIYDGLDPVGQDAARQLFLRLVTLGEGSEDTRRRVLRAELESLAGSGQQSVVSDQTDVADSAGGSPIPGPWSPIPQADRPSASDSTSAADSMSSIIDLFGAARLLTFDHDPITRGPTVEVAHEALLREWRQLRQWLDSSRDDVRLQRMLARATAEWQTSDEDDSYLLRGSRLAQFEGWATDSSLALTGVEQRFLACSVAAREARQAEEEERLQRELETAQKLAETERARAEEQAQSARSLRRRAASLAGALVVAGLLAIAAFFFAGQSIKNANVASTSEAEALVLADQRATAQAASDAYAAEAIDQRATAQAEADFRATAEAVAVKERDLAEIQTALATSRELSLAALNNLEADPELSMLLALQALDISYTKEAAEALHQGLQASRVLMRLSDGPDPFYGVAFSPDGLQVAAVSDDGASEGSVRIWDLESQQLLHRLIYRGTEALGNTLKYDVSGQRLALVANEDSQQVVFHIWDAETGDLLNEQELPITGHKYTVKLSPDWTKVAARFEDGRAGLWDTNTGEMLLSMPEADVDVNAVAFSPDGSRLLTASRDGQVIVWDVKNSLTSGAGQPLISFNETNDNDVIEAGFNNEGTKVILGYAASDFELWELADTRSPQYTISGDTGWPLNFAFDPLEQYAASASTDGTARVWDLTTGRNLFTLAGHKGIVQNLAFSPDGRRLATVGADGTVRIWDARAAAGGEILTLAGAYPSAEDLELSPDERKVALGSRTGPVTIWDLQTGDLLLTLPGDAETGVYRAAFRPDASRIATAGADNMIRVWDAESGELLRTIAGHGEVGSGLYTGVIDVAYSPDGTRLASAGRDGIAKVWDAETGEELLTLTGHTAGLESLAYSPNGRYIATSSDNMDSSVKVWDAQTGEEIYSFGPNPDRANGLAFSDDSGLLAAGGTGGYIKVWDMNSGALVSEMIGQASTIGSLVFMPDGERLVSGGVVSASLWDIASGVELLNLSPGNRFKIDLTHDGEFLYTADYQTGTVRVLVVSDADAKALARARLTRSLTEEECQQYLHLDSCPE